MGPTVLNYNVDMVG